jgi:hypothetical protein
MFLLSLFDCFLKGMKEGKLPTKVRVQAKKGTKVSFALSFINKRSQGVTITTKE